MINTRFQLTKVALMPRTFGMWAASANYLPENCLLKFGSWQPKSSGSFADWQVSLCSLCFLLLLLDDMFLHILISSLHVRGKPWLSFSLSEFKDSKNFKYNDVYLAIRYVPSCSLSYQRPLRHQQLALHIMSHSDRHLGYKYYAKRSSL